MPAEADERTLYHLFGPFGAITNANVIRHFSTGACKGYGFVTMMNYSEAVNAIQYLNGSNYAGRNLQVGSGTARLLWWSRLKFLTLFLRFTLHWILPHRSPSSLTNSAKRAIQAAVVEHPTPTFRSLPCPSGEENGETDRFLSFCVFRADIRHLAHFLQHGHAG